MTEKHPKATQSTRALLQEIIFGIETPAGKLFDVCLIILILLSVVAVLLDSVPLFNQRFHTLLYFCEWVFTLVFSVEYGLRIYSSPQRLRYVFSFYGLVDLCSILPAYISLFLSGASYLAVIRLLRVLRIFRVLKLMNFIGDANILTSALLHSRRKIFIFVFGVLVMNVIFGSLMYVVEGPENGYTSIPVSIYWAIVTLTTVGYGDISPHTDLGRLIAALAMLTGYAIIAVPTGIVSSELMNEIQNKQQEKTTDFKMVCTSCFRKGHDRDAHYCKQCGSRLPA